MLILMGLRKKVSETDRRLPEGLRKGQALVRLLFPQVKPHNGIRVPMQFYLLCKFRKKPEPLCRVKDSSHRPVALTCLA